MGITGNDAIGRQWLRDTTVLPPLGQEHVVARPLIYNEILASLPPADLAAIHPYLAVVDLPQETVLFERGDIIKAVYFPHDGMISLVVDLASGEMVEAAMVGRDGVAGGSSALNSQISLNRAVVQIAGQASVLDVERFLELVEQSASARAKIMRHEQFVLVQAQQSAACNATHSVEARLSRWLLRCRDVLRSDNIPLTQEFLAEMLAVRRTSVSIVAHTLQQAGFIRYRRGHIRVLDVDGLLESTCECYATIKSYADRLLVSAPNF
jgi:CRP-like cAMP-binding protein